MPATRTVLARGTLVYLRRPVQRDASPFLTAVESSKRLHGLWVQPPSTPSSFASYVRRFSGARSRDSRHATHVGILVCRREDHAPVGVFNFSAIVRGAKSFGAFTPVPIAVPPNGNSKSPSSAIASRSRDAST